MQRRTVLKAALGGAAATLAAPAVAQSAPETRWRMASSFPKSLDAMHGAGEVLARYVAEASDNRFQIQVFAPGEIVGGLQVLDAVSSGTVDACHTASFYNFGKDPTFAFATTMPFGLNTRQQEAWMAEGGGEALMAEFFRSHGVVGLQAGNTGAQMGGWFRKELKTVEDFKGLKFRISGLAGQVVQKLGAVPQQIAGGDLYPALERGTIDAAEWIGPYDDEKLGFAKVAPYYYYPGWWEGGAMVHAFVNQAKWSELPKHYQAILRGGCDAATKYMMTRYDARNSAALRRLVANGTQLRPYPQDILEAAYKATFELYGEIAAKNATFKKVYDSWSAFRSDAYTWFRVAETSFEAFAYAQRGKVGF